MDVRSADMAIEVSVGERFAVGLQIVFWCVSVRCIGVEDVVLRKVRAKKRQEVRYMIVGWLGQESGESKRNSFLYNEKAQKLWLILS